MGDIETVTRLHQEGCTIQLHQPQRWNEELWRLIAALERQLGCLVGANAYLTPAGDVQSPCSSLLSHYMQPMTITSVLYPT